MTGSRGMMRYSLSLEYLWEYTSHGLLLQGPIFKIIADIVVMTLIILLISNGMTGHFMGRGLNRLEQTVAILVPIAFVLVQPFQDQYLYWMGSLLIGILASYLWIKARRNRIPGREVGGNLLSGKSGQS